MTPRAFENRNSLLRTVTLTTLALFSFAANSVLCRLALAEEAIDAASFTGIRILAGAAVLIIIIRAKHRKADTQKVSGSWAASLMLCLYAVTFSYAYITLDTATGALILFGAVQITMILLAIVAGERLQRREWLGLFIAFAGFVTLVLPGVTAPSVAGFLLMAAAGIAWGGYTLKGRRSTQPLLDTGWNFIRALPCVAVLALVALPQSSLTATGVLLAALSGGIASGVGYTIWYAALNGLSASQAATVQLLVPVIAAAGGVVIVSEPLTLRLVLASTLILGGIALTVARTQAIKRNSL